MNDHEHPDCLTVGVLALDVSSARPAVLLRLEELLELLWLLGEAVRWDTKDTGGSGQTQRKVPDVDRDQVNEKTQGSG